MEPFFCSFPCLCRPHQARPDAESTVAARECPSRDLVEGLVAHSELLARYRHFSAIASSTPSLEGLSLHIVFHNCCDLAFPLRYICRLLQLLRKAFTEISRSCFHLVDGVGRLGVWSDCPTSQPLDNCRLLTSAMQGSICFPSGRCTPIVFLSTPYLAVKCLDKDLRVISRARLSGRCQAVDITTSLAFRIKSFKLLRLVFSVEMDNDCLLNHGDDNGEIGAVVTEWLDVRLTRGASGADPSELVGMRVAGNSSPVVPKLHRCSSWHQYLRITQGCHLVANC